MTGAAETEETPGTPSEGRRGVLTWLPLALWTGGVLAVLRTGVLLSLAHRLVAVANEKESQLFLWDAAGTFPDLVVDCLIVGTLASVVATSVPAGRRALLTGFMAAVFLCVLSGWPLAPAYERSRWTAELALDDAVFLAVLSVVLAVGLFAGARSAERGARWSSGPVAAVVAGILALGAPLAYSYSVQSAPPAFEVRGVVRDFLADTSWTVVTQNEALPPAVTVITPAVEQHTDSADKPSLWMAPPCTVELTVNAGDGDVVLRGAAGVDKTVRGRMPPGVTRVTVDFTVSKNGEPIFEERIVSERPDPSKPWDPSDWVWRHLGEDGNGVPLEPGDVVRLETRIPPGDQGENVPPELLRVGFGGLALERRVERPRTLATPEAPNLVLIVMDTLRADRMSCYGYERATTPHIDALAARGVLFDNAHSTSSWTWPSTASILTGLPADAHGVVSNDSCTLNLSLASLPEALQARGYTTAGFSANPLIAPERYFDQGFESFDAPRREFRMSDEVVPGVLRWIDGHAGARFFLYLHLADPHTPHRPHPEEVARLGVERPDGYPENGMDRYTSALLAAKNGDRDSIVPASHRRWIHDQYDASVATGDRWVGEVFRALEGHGLLDKTVIAFTSDHGEELFDHALLEHGHTLYAELVNVPLILAGPGIPRGERRDAVVSNRHLGPTIARLGGAELTGMGDSRFLLDTLDDEAAVFQTVKGQWNGQRMQSLIGVRRGDWVLHWREGDWDAPELDDFRLFDVGADPNQRLDRKLEQADLAKSAWAELKTELEKQRAFAPAHRVGVGADGLGMLYAVGYAHGGEEEDEDDDDAGEDR